MPSRLRHRYSTDGTPTTGDVRDALADVSDDDLSVSSPVTGGIPEAGISWDGTDLLVTIEGHDGDWTKTSETAISGAVTSVDGVDELAESEDGYVPDDSDEDTE